MKTAIVGGGITGLSVAYELAKKGETPVLYERGARPGGLVATFQIAGTRLEKYFHHIFLSDTELRGLIRELGLDQDMVWKVTPMGFFGNGRIHSFDGAMDLLRFSVLSPIDRIRFGFHVFRAGRMKGGLTLDRMTAREWVETSWGGDIYRNFWGPLLQSKFSDAADRISAAWLWGRIYARANSRSGGREKLGYLRGGFSRIVDEMGKFVMQKGGTLKLQQEVRAVVRKGNQWAIQTRDESEEYDRVVLAIPSPLVPGICPDLPEEEKAIHGNISYVSILCMPMIMTRPLSKIYWLNVGDRTIPYTGVIEQTNYIGPEEYGGKHIAYLFNYLPMGHPWLSDSKDVVFARYEEGLRRMFPAFTPDQIEQTMIFRDTYANAVYDLNYLQKIPPLQSRLPGLYFANTAHIFPDDRNQNFSVVLARRLVRLLYP